MERGAWWATVHGVAKSQTRLSEHTPSISVTSTPLSSDHRHPQGHHVPLHPSLLPPSTSRSVIFPGEGKMRHYSSITCACPPKASYWTGRQPFLPLFYSHGASHLGGVPST